MNRNVKKRYITWLLFVLNIFYIFMYIFKYILCPNEILKFLVIKTWISFHHGYKFGVNDLKGTGGVKIFVY